MCLEDIKDPNEPNMLLPYEVPKNHKLYSIALGNQTVTAKLYNLFRRNRTYTKLVDLLVDNNYFVLPNKLIQSGVETEYRVRYEYENS